MRKPTSMMTNSPEVARRLDKRCCNKVLPESEHHRHVTLINGRASHAQVYPRALCRAVCEGVAWQKKMDAKNLVAMDVMSVGELFDMGKDDLHECHGDAEAFDDVTNEPLRPELVIAARAEELKYFEDMEVYEYATLDECMQVTKRPPIGTRWIDINKGDAINTNYRSRLVAKEYKVDIRPELFAATPPTECLRLLLSKAAECRKRKVLYIDVSRAYFYAKSIRPTYIKLPEEDARSGEPGLVGRLKYSMYGTRDAAQNWAEEYSATLVKAGYQRGRANPCLFYSPTEDCSIMVHGDDFVAVGDERSTKKLQTSLETACKVKCEVLGDGADEKKEIRVLNRIIRRVDTGFALEADPRHAEIIIRDLGLVGAKPSKLPGSKEDHKKAGGGPHGAGVYPRTAEVSALSSPTLPSPSTTPTAAPWYAQLTPEYYKLFMKGKGRGGAAEISTLGAQQAPVQPSDGATAELDQESPGRQVPSVEASPQVGDLLSGVLGDREGPGALSSPQRGTMPGGVVGGPGPRTHSERHAPSTSYLWAVGCMDELSTAEVDKKDEEPDTTPLERADAKVFRAVAARLNYLGPDRPDMQYAIKEAARCMSAPRECDWILLKRMGRYLIHRPRLVMEFEWQRRPGCLDGYTDSDWGGCTQSRKSTSGAVIMVGKHLIKGYSKQQKVLALSSAEAETYGMVACSAEVLGIQSCALDLGLDYAGVIYADASAALGIIMRRGIGKVRHIRTQSLWLQEAHATKRLGFEKIDGSRNPSDLMTKHLTDTLQQRHLDYIRARAAEGRAETAPELSNIEEIINSHYLLGTVFSEAPVGILKNISMNIIEKDERESGAPVSSDSRDCQLPLRHSAISMRSNSSSSGRRRKHVRFSPLVAEHSVVAYSQVYGMHPNKFHFDAQGNLVVGWLKTTPVSARESQRAKSVDPISTVEPVSSLNVFPRADSSHKEECKSRASRSVASDGSTVSQADGQTEEAKPADIDCSIMSAWLKPFDCRAPVRSAASLPSLR